MNNKIVTTALVLATLMGSYQAGAQTAEDNKNAESLNIAVGGSFAKPKIMPHLEKFGIAQLTVDYKLTTMERATGKDKSSGKVAGAKVSAFLETTDGQLTPADFQEVTDHFYSYFQKKLKAGGIDTVAWSAVTATDFYKNADDNKADNDEKGNNNVHVTYNARNGNSMNNGKIAFAFGKIKKAARFAEEIGGPAGFFHVTVDFADVEVGVDIKSKTHDGWNVVERTTTFKYDAAVKPQMKVTPSDYGNSLLWNEKSQGESIVVQEDIEGKTPYHTAVVQDNSRLKNNLFAFAKEMNPIVIETTRAKYKAAAKVALEKYADAFIAKAKLVKKD